MHGVYDPHLFPQWMIPLALLHTRACTYTTVKMKTTLCYKGLSISKRFLSAVTESHEYQGVFVSLLKQPMISLVALSSFSGYHFSVSHCVLHHLK